MKRLKTFLLICLTLPCVASGADIDYATQIAETREYIKLMQDEITQIDSELARCRKQKNTWKTLTVVGGAGVVGTGIGAIVQANKISRAKKSGAVEQAADKTTTDQGDKTE